jgi:glycosyltransferase involved in cell wall biosynthesis
VESIKAQTFTDWEIVVVDDGSTDTTEMVLQHYKRELGEQFSYEKSGMNLGIARTRNRANQIASGKVICVQDADDLSQKDRLKKTWKYFERHKDVDLIYGAYQYIDLFGKPGEREDAKPFVFEDWSNHNYIAHPTVAYRKELTLKVPYRDDCRVLDDLFLYMDVHKAGLKIAHLEDTLAFYRIRAASVSQSKVREIEEFREKFRRECLH